MRWPGPGDLRYRPVAFFAIALGWTFLFELLSILASTRDPTGDASNRWLLVGVLGPTLATTVLLAMARNKVAWTDLGSRIADVRRVSPITLLAILIFPATLLVGILVTIVAGGSASQLGLTPWGDFFSGPVPALVLILFGVTAEEIGWRGYGIDALRSRTSLWTATWIFIAIWMLWHVPTFFSEAPT